MELLNNLNINPLAIIINVVGFLLLLFIANKLVFKPIGKVIDERQHDITSTYNKIDADKAQMEATRVEYQRRLAEIEEERRATVQRAISEAQQTRDQIIHEATVRAQEMNAQAAAEVAREREQAMITLRQQMVDLALGATTKLIGDNLDENRQRRLIDEFIATGGAASVNSPAGAPPARPAAGV
jgi:F-type H+-transporting ATPase subunit b